MYTSMLTALLIVLAGFLGLVLIDHPVRRARERVVQWGRRVEAERAGGPRGALPVVQAPEPVPAEETARHWLKETFCTRAILGFLLMPAFLVFLAANAYVVASALEFAFGMSPETILLVRLLGHTVEVTNLGIAAIVLALALAILGATTVELQQRKSALRWLTAAGVVAILIVEASLAGYHGWAVAPPSLTARLVNGMGRGLMAAASGIVDLALGYFVLHSALVPAILLVLWGFVAPFRALARAMSARDARRSARAAAELGGPRPGVFTRLLSWGDGVLKPFRDLDDWVCERLRGFRRVGRTLPAMLLLLTPHEVHAQWIQAAPAPARTTWVIVLDTTPSIPEARFSRFRTIVKDGVLCRAQPGDAVILTTIAPLKTWAWTLDRRLWTAQSQVGDIQDTLAVIRVSRDPNCATDLSRALNIISRRLSQDQRLSGGLAPASRPTEHRLLLLTDGVPTGRQSEAGAPPVEGWKMLVIGVGLDDEPRLTVLLASAGFTDESRVQIIPWELSEGLDQVVTGFWDRKKNADFCSALSGASLERSR